MSQARLLQAVLPIITLIWKWCWRVTVKYPVTLPVPIALQLSESKALCVTCKLSILGYVSACWFSRKSQKRGNKNTAFRFLHFRLKWGLKTQGQLCCLLLFSQGEKMHLDRDFKSFLWSSNCGKLDSAGSKVEQPARSLEITFDMLGFLLHGRL